MAIPAQKKIQFSLRNSLSTNAVVVLEPWGDEHTLKPNESITLLAEGPSDGHLEIEMASGRLLVYGWTGSVIEVLPKDLGPSVRP